MTVGGAETQTRTPVLGSLTWSSLHTSARESLQYSPSPTSTVLQRYFYSERKKKELRVAPITCQLKKKKKNLN